MPSAPTKDTLPQLHQAKGLVAEEGGSLVRAEGMR